MQRNRPKVFCVGFNKTGTTSLATVLADLGYELGDQRRGEALLGAWHRRDFEPIVRFCKSAQAFQDVPFSLPHTYAVLDQAFPGSKFILTERDSPDQWFESLVGFHSRLWADGSSVPTAEQLKSARYRYRGFAYDYQRFVYDVSDDDLYNHEALTGAYVRHNQNVRDYFRSRPERLVVINVSKQPDFRRLCAFLGTTSTQQDFPWVNRTE